MPRRPRWSAATLSDDGDVAAVEAEPLAQDPAARHLEDREVDARVLQHHARRLRARTRRPG